MVERCECGADDCPDSGPEATTNHGATIPCDNPDCKGGLIFVSNERPPGQCYKCDGTGRIPKPPMPNDSTAYEGHTPEPWVYSCGAVYSEQPISPDGYPLNRLLEADRDNESTNPCERDANCRLAADAPKLLKERDELREHVIEVDTERGYHEWKIAQLKAQCDELQSEVKELKERISKHVAHGANLGDAFGRMETQRDELAEALRVMLEHWHPDACAEEDCKICERDNNIAAQAQAALAKVEGAE